MHGDGSSERCAHEDQRFVRRAHATASLAGESRRPFFHESRNSLAIIAAAAKLTLGIAFEIQLPIQRIAGRSVDQSLGGRQSHGWRGGKWGRQLVHRTSQLVIRPRIARSNPRRLLSDSLRHAA